MYFASNFAYLSGSDSESGSEDEQDFNEDFRAAIVSQKVPASGDRARAAGAAPAAAPAKKGAGGGGFFSRLFGGSSVNNADAGRAPADKQKPAVGANGQADFDADDGDAPAPAGGPRRNRRSSQAVGGGRHAKKMKQAHTNVVGIAFGGLADKVELFPGDPVLCGGCPAALSQTSRLLSVAEYRDYLQQLKQDRLDKPAAAAADPEAKEQDAPQQEQESALPPAEEEVEPVEGQPDEPCELAPWEEEARAAKQKLAAEAADAAAASAQQEAELDVELEAADPEDTRVWLCEFCDRRNLLDIDPEELPGTDTRDYMLEPAPHVDLPEADQAAAAGGDAGDAQQQRVPLVIFCVDTSGSMCVTTEVQGGFKLKKVADQGMPDIPADLMEDYEAQMAEINRPQQARGNRGGMQMFRRPVRPQPIVPEPPRVAPQKTTWVSRLQCVQAAVESQLELWSKTQPDMRVSLLTFNNEVTVLGSRSQADGAGQDDLTIAGARLSDQNQLQQIGADLALPGRLGDCYEDLSRRLWGLQEGGATALGPALLTAVSLASRRPGSRVVVCTDGLANVGIGAFDQPVAAGQQDPKLWYEGLANLARLAGVAVSVISIKGDECALEDLGKVSEVTGGQVDRVDPLKLTDNFANLLDSATLIATNVRATVVLHKALRRVQDAEEAEAEAAANKQQAAAAAEPDKAVADAAEQNHFVREVGNATAETEINFEYWIDRSKFPTSASGSVQSPDSLPFQVQLQYTRLDGSVCLKVISRSQPITKRRREAVESAKLEILAAHQARQSAYLAKKGDYEQARVQGRAWGRLFNKSVQAKARGGAEPEKELQQQQQVYQAWESRMSAFDRSLASQQEGVQDLKKRKKVAKVLNRRSEAAAEAGGVGGGFGFMAKTRSASRAPAAPQQQQQPLAFGAAAPAPPPAMAAPGLPSIADQEAYAADFVNQVDLDEEELANVSSDDDDAELAREVRRDQDYMELNQMMVQSSRSWR